LLERAVFKTRVSSRSCGASHHCSLGAATFAFAKDQAGSTSVSVLKTARSRPWKNRFPLRDALAKGKLTLLENMAVFPAQIFGLRSKKPQPEFHELWLEAVT